MPGPKKSPTDLCQRVEPLKNGVPDASSESAPSGGTHPRAIPYDYTIVGGGILGLTTAYSLAQRYPGCRLLILEKEADVSLHQTGRNSGVIHSGIYYKPGGLKAKLARAGNDALVAFCRRHDIAHEICGKVIVATDEEELAGLESLYQRGLENGLKLTRLTAEEVREREPHVRCRAGIWVPTTGIVDYRQVCRKLVTLLEATGCEIRFNSPVTRIFSSSDGVRVRSSGQEHISRFLINCTGLHSDRVAALGGLRPKARIVPFRGEYYELIPERRYLVKGLIYPVPNPAFPFLGVHFTRMIDGSVHAGPNAVLSLRREGYRKTDFNLRDFAEVMTYPGFWKLAARHYREGLKEVVRSISKTAFVRSLRKMIPEVNAEDLVPTHAGVRAQALLPDGQLVDDFLIEQQGHAFHVCNAPSPAATASLEIGRFITEQLPPCITGDATGFASPRC